MRFGFHLTMKNCLAIDWSNCLLVRATDEIFFSFLPHRPLGFSDEELEALLGDNPSLRRQCT